MHNCPAPYSAPEFSGAGPRRDDAVHARVGDGLSHVLIGIDRILRNTASAVVSRPRNCTRFCRSTVRYTLLTVSRDTRSNRVTSAFFTMLFSGSFGSVARFTGEDPAGLLEQPPAAECQVHVDFADRAHAGRRPPRELLLGRGLRQLQELFGRQRELRLPPLSEPGGAVCDVDTEGGIIDHVIATTTIHRRICSRGPPIRSLPRVVREKQAMRLSRGHRGPSGRTKERSGVAAEAVKGRAVFLTARGDDG